MTNKSNNYIQSLKRRSENEKRIEFELKVECDRIVLDSKKCGEASS